MDGYRIMIFGTTAAASGAALTAVVLNRFRKVLAGIVVLSAGVCPWLFVLLFHGWVKGNVMAGLGLYAAMPMFCLAFVLYGIGKKTAGGRAASIAALTGMFISLGTILFWFHLLSKME